MLSWAQALLQRSPMWLLHIPQAERPQPAKSWFKITQKQGQTGIKIASYHLINTPVSQLFLCFMSLNWADGQPPHPLVVKNKHGFRKGLVYVKNFMHVSHLFFAFAVCNSGIKSGALHIPDKHPTPEHPRLWQLYLNQEIAFYLAKVLHYLAEFPLCPDKKNALINILVCINCACHTHPITALKAEPNVKIPIKTSSFLFVFKICMFMRLRECMWRSEDNLYRGSSLTPPCDSQGSNTSLSGLVAYTFTHWAIFPGPKIDFFFNEVWVSKIQDQSGQLRLYFKIKK